MTHGPLKWHGGKHYLARQIVSLFPPHTHFVEPYAGGLAVLLAKLPKGSEVVNDLHGDLMNFWRVLQDEAMFRRFRRRVQAVPFSEVEWHDAKQSLREHAVREGQEGLIERAASFFIVCRQSLAGRCEDFASLSRNRTRRGMNEQASAWLNAVAGLEQVHNRLQRVVILNKTAMEVLHSEDGPETLFYLDPPYLPETKSSKAFGDLEMTVEQHEELLDRIVELHGKVIISGYPSALYEKRLRGWHKHTFTLANHAATGSLKRNMTEVVWCNFKPRELDPSESYVLAAEHQVA